MILDGTRDLFQAGAKPSTGGPIPGTPCSYRLTGKVVSFSCPLLHGLGISVDSEGNVKYSWRLKDIATRLVTIWKRGGPGKDTCYCDPSIPGKPEFTSDGII